MRQFWSVVLSLTLVLQNLPTFAAPATLGAADNLKLLQTGLFPDAELSLTTDSSGGVTEVRLTQGGQLPLRARYWREATGKVTSMQINNRTMDLHALNDELTRQLSDLIESEEIPDDTEIQSLIEVVKNHLLQELLLTSSAEVRRHIASNAKDPGSLKNTDLALMLAIPILFGLGGMFGLHYSTTAGWIGSGIFGYLVFSLVLSLCADAIQRSVDSKADRGSSEADAAAQRRQQQAQSEFRARAEIAKAQAKVAADNLALIVDFKDHRTYKRLIAAFNRMSPEQRLRLTVDLKSARGATSKQVITNRYRTLVKHFHPDMNPTGDKAEIQFRNELFALLAGAKAELDETLKRGGSISWRTKSVWTFASEQCESALKTPNHAAP